MAQNDVSTPTNIQRAMVEDARPIRVLMGGTKAMRKAGEEFLPKELGESQSAYDARKKRSVLFNATEKTVGDMTGKVFAKPITVGKSVDTTLAKWLDNIDNAGRHLNVFARDVFYDAMQPGIGFILVDMPQPVQRADGQPATRADEQAAGMRPYCTFIPLERLIGWKSTTEGGAVELTEIRIRECVTEQDPENPFNEIDVDQIRVITKTPTGVAWQTFRKATKDEDADWLPFENGVLPPQVTQIALVPVYTKRTDFMQASPPLAKLAELNIAHWQSSSDQRNILHVARVPILFGAGFGDDDKLVIGASEMVRSARADAKLQYIEHSGAAIGSGDKDIQNLEMQMQVMGLQLLVDGVKGQTATGEIRDDVKENSPLAMMAAQLQDALTQAAALMAQFGKVNPPKAGDILISKDFGITGNRFDLQFLTQAVIAGKISQETYWLELQRRGALSEQFDPAVEAARVAAEAPEMSIPPGGGLDLGPGGIAAQHAAAPGKAPGK